MKDFWEEQALKYKDSVKAVNFDPLAEELELNTIDSLIKDKQSVCDLGCGNGLLLLHLAKKFPLNKFYGFDFSDSMIENANNLKKEHNLDNVEFKVFDLTQNIIDIIDIKFDVVITKRLLINLKGETKFKAIHNINNLLKKEGTYIMFECFIEPLDKINEIRKLLNLKEIEVKFFNEYLNYNFIEEISDIFSVKDKKDFGSLYYFISRIFNAYLSEGEASYNAPINELAVNLSKKGFNPISGYSPEIMYIFEKKI